MKNLKTRPFAFLLFGLFLVAFGGLAIATGVEINDIWGALKTAYRAMLVLLGFWVLFTLYAWKWPIFRNWLVPFPCIEGTWEGEIQSTWIDPETGQVPGPIPAILTIKQSFIRLSCVMRTAEMTSRSYFADFWLDSDEQLRKLGYCYASTPSVTVRDRSQPHDGTMVLELIGDPVKKLRGSYWTTRKTTGEVTLAFRCKKRLDEYPAEVGAHPMQETLESKADG